MNDVWGSNTNPLTINSKGANEKVIALLQEQQTNNASSLLLNAFICKYNLTAKQFDALSRVMNPIIVRFPTVGDLANASHPVAAALNAFAYQQCLSTAKKFKRSIDIGGTPLRTPKDHHMCTLVNDCRTDARYMRASFNQRGVYHNNLIDMRGYIHDSNGYCINGVQNCNYQADYAYCVNAAYDIDIELWPQIFAKHNLTVVDIWMFMPTQLINESYITDNDIYNIKIDGDVVTVDYLDHSNNYTHSKKRWRKYYETTVIKCQNFNLVFEMEKNYGTYTNIKITRTNRQEGIITRTIKTSTLVQTAIVPDIYHYIMNNRTYKDIFEKNFCVPIPFLNRLVNWATGQLDDAFKYNQFALFAFSIVNSVSYRSGASIDIVYQGMECTSVEFERIKISCFIIIAIMRYKRTVAVAQGFNKLKNNQYQPGRSFNNFIIWLKHKVGSGANSVGDALTNWLSDDNKDIWIHKNFIYNAEFRYPTDHQFNTVIHSEVGHIFNDYRVYDPYKIDETSEVDSRSIVDSDQAPPKEKERDWRKEDADHIYAWSQKKHGVDRRMSTSTVSDISIKSRDSISPVCECKLIYNPPGDGRCGEHALRYIKKDLILTDIMSCDGRPYDIPANWYSAEDIINIAYTNQINVVVHANGVPIINTITNDGPTYSINCNNSHYQVVDCPCCYTRHMIGHYSEVAIKEGLLYVNAANEQLNDRAGQALAFAQKFPGYAQAFTVPIDIIQYQQVNYDDGEGNMTPIHLCAAVGHNNTGVKSYEKTIARYHEIFKSMSEYANKHDIAVLLPKIGTSIYGGDLCCFKNTLNQYNFKRIIVHLDEKSYQAYINTGPCRHAGGYNLLSSNKARILLNNGSSCTKDHAKIPINYPNSDKMCNKFRDIVKYIKDRKVKFDYIHELSAAPGDFYKYAPQDIHMRTSVFIGNGALKWRHNEKPDFYYNNIGEHIDELIDIGEVNKNVIYLFDYYIDDDMISAFSKLINIGAHVITKVDTYADPKLIQKFNTIYNTGKIMSTLIQNDHSDLKSSELYVHFQLIKDKDQPNIITEKHDLQDLQDKQIDIAEKKVHQHKCTCDIKDYQNHVEQMVNCDIKWNLLSPGDYFKDFVSNADDVSFKNCTLATIAGAAGSRKTQSLIKHKNNCPKCTLIVSPFSAISQDNNNQVEGISKTFVVALDSIKTNKYKTIIIDEALSMSGYHIALIKHHAKDALIFGATDPYQITYRNYHNTVENYEITYRPGKKYINVTYRVPQIICDIFKDYVRLESKATNAGKITYRKLEDFQPVADKRHIFLTFTQDMCNHFKNNFKEGRYNINTVNASQGSTHDIVHLYYPDYIKLKEQHFSYIYTAMSRCRTELIIYSQDGKSITLPLIDTPIQRTIDTHVMPLHDTAFVLERDVEEKPRHFNLVTLNGSISSQELVEEVMNRNLPTANEPYSACIGYFSRTIPQNVAKHTCKFSINYVKEKVVVNGRMIGKRPYQLIYTPKNTSQTVHCLLTRYAKEDKKLPTSMFDRYVKGFEKWLKPDYKKVIKNATQTENLYAGIVQYIKNLQKKFSNMGHHLLDVLENIELDRNDVQRIKNLRNFGSVHKDYITNNDPKIHIKEVIYRIIEIINNTDTRSKIKDIELEWYDAYHKVIQFHLKRQPKLVLSPEGPAYDTQEKAGQGVSAWSKMLNIIFSGYIRCVAESIPKVTLSNVQLAYGMSDANISLFFQRFSEQLSNNNFKKLTADFSEFDSSQEMQGILAGATYFKLCGVPDHIVEMYLSQRRRWLMLAVDKDDSTIMRAMLEGVWKQHSGQPDTLNGNTTFNMAAMGACYNITDLQFASFKGDDSIICARKIEANKDGQMSIAELAKFKIKEDYSDIPEYIANIILPSGKFMPDVVRRASRVLSKVYSDKADWKEQRQSLLDCLDVVDSDQHLHIGNQIAQKYYANHGVKITEKEINAILTWLKDMSKLDDINHIPVKDHYIYNF